MLTQTPSRDHPGIRFARASAFASTLILALIANSPPAFSSCWASNPDGTRSCSRYVNPSGALEYLCEDRPGDCENLGYTKAPIRPRESHRLSPPEPLGESPETRIPTTVRPSERAADTRAHPHRVEPLPESGGEAKSPRAPHADESPGDFSPPAEPLGAENEVALGLIGILTLIGISILPPTHRAVLARIAKGMAVIAGAILILFLILMNAASKSSGSRRRRYY